MKNLNLFEGRLGRKHYIYATLIFSSIFAVCLKVFSGDAGYFFTILFYFLAILIIDAKRFRDLDASGGFAIIPFLLKIFAFFPSENAYGFIFLAAIITWYLLLKKGDSDENQYGMPTGHQGFWKALFSEKKVLSANKF